MVTFALTALTYLWVKRFCEGHGRVLYFLPAVMLVWVNLHAGFVVAYAVVGTALLLEGLRYLARRPGAMPIDRLKAMGIVLLAAVAVAIVNPNGWDIYLYPFQTGGSPEQQRLIVEWFSPNFQMSQIWPFEAMVFLIIGGLALAPAPDVDRHLRRERPDGPVALRRGGAGQRPQPGAARRRQARGQRLSHQGGRLSPPASGARAHAQRLRLGRIPDLPALRPHPGATGFHLWRRRPRRRPAAARLFPPAVAGVGPAAVAGALSDQLGHLPLG